MSTYRIDFPALVDDDLLAEIEQAVGPDVRLPRERARSAVARILKATGGWPYINELPSAGEVHSHVRRLFSEAVSHMLGGSRTPVPGYRGTEVGDDRLNVEATARVPVNLASAEALMNLSGMTSRQANEVIRHRETTGPFRGVKDLADRVNGIGEVRGAALKGQLDFRREPGPVLRSTGDVWSDLSILVDLEQPGDLSERTLAALERIAATALAHRHPYLKHRIPRSFSSPAVPSALPTNGSIVLHGSDYYYYVLGLIASAERSIDVLMFHIAWPKPDHPTRELLEALVKAHTAGIRVRVMVDLDRRADPYKSRVINANAAKYLITNGITVKEDTPDQLLHSKMVIVDEHTTVIGSHNWSAGSYFSFDDLSLSVLSPDLGSASTERFDAVWSRGTVMGP